MKIIQIINNNVALVTKGGHEVFIVSKGIGFRKKKNQKIDETEIDKMYILDSFEMLEHFSYLLSNSDPNDIILISKIIEDAEMALHIKASDYMSLTLLDHLEFLLERGKKGQYISSPLVWDIKRFYPKHFEVGVKTLRIIEKEKNMVIPDDEAVSIALHFINVGDRNDSKSIRLLEMQTLSDIVSIIEKHYSFKIDENSTNFMRFSTHLQYFIQRLVRNEMSSSDESDLNLHKQISQIYPESFKVVQKIKIYVSNEFKDDISISEETYMMMHINRLTERIELNNEL